jgi:hypothetical protein
MPSASNGEAYRNPKQTSHHFLVLRFQFQQLRQGDGSHWVLAQLQLGIVSAWLWFLSRKTAFPMLQPVKILDQWNYLTVGSTVLDGLQEPMSWEYVGIPCLRMARGEETREGRPPERRGKERSHSKTGEEQLSSLSLIQVNTSGWRKSWLMKSLRKAYVGRGDVV